MSSKNDSAKRGGQRVKDGVGAVKGVIQKVQRNDPTNNITKPSEGDGKIAVALGTLMGHFLSGEKKESVDAFKGLDPKSTLFGRVDIIAKYIEDLQKNSDDEEKKEQKSFQEKLTSYITEDAKKMSDNIEKILDVVTKAYTTQEKEEEKPEEDKKDEDILLDMLIESKGDAGEFFKIVSEDPKMGEKMTESMKAVTEGVKASEETFKAMKDASESATGIDSYKAAMEKVEETNDKTKEVTDKVDPQEAAKQKKSFEDMGEVMLGIAAMSLVLIAVGLLADKINFGGLLAFAICLGAFLIAIGFSLKIAWENMEINQKSIEAALILVAGSALIMLLGGAIMEYIDIGNLILFTAALAGFLLAVGWALKVIDIKSYTKEALYALVLVAGAALIMFLGAALVPLVEVKALAQFTILLGGFLFAIGKVLKWVGKSFSKITRNAIWALAIVAGAALIMFLGAAIMDLVNMGNLVLFTVTLAGFMLAIAGVMWVVGKAFNKIKREMLYGLAMVAGAALIMFLGAAVIDLINLGNLVIFTLTLTAFLGAITLVFWLGKNAYKEGLKGAKDAAILVVAAGAILLIGGLVMKFIEYADIILFTVLLDILLLGVSLSFAIIQNVQDMESKAIGMLLVIGIGGLMLLAGGLIISKFPDLPINVVIFVGLLGALLIGVALIMALLGAFESFITQGVIICGAIVAIVAIGAIGFILLNTAINGGGGPVNMLINAATFVGVLGILGLGMSLLGLIAPAIIAGLSAVVAITAAIVIGTAGIGVLVGAMKLLASAPKIDTKLIMSNVSLILGIAGMLAPLVFLSGPLVAVASTILLLAKAISAIAEAVGDIAELKIPIEWNQAGRPIKYRELKKADFKAAGENTGLIVSTLTEGIMKVYDKHKDWYAGSGLFSNSPLEKVIKQSAKLQELLSAIAAGVKAWAQLQVPDQWDSKSGRPIHFRDMKPHEPQQAADNVVAVITTISNGIMKLWEDHKEWYDSNAFTTSPLVKVIKQNLHIQDLLSAIAAGVKAWAQLQVPDKWDDKTGKPIHYRELKPDEPNQAAKNVVKVITTISNGIMQLWEEHKEWYNDTEGGFLGMGKSTPFAKVIKQNMKIQDLMSAIAQGVKAWATMQVPIAWDPKTGKPIKFEPIKEDAPMKAATNVIAVVSAISESLMEAYDEHPEWYTEIGGNWLKSGSSPLQKVISQSIKIQELMSGIAQGVKAWALMQVPDKWDPKTGKPISFRDLKPEEPGLAAVNTATVIAVLFEAIEGVYEGNEDWFEDSGGVLGLGGSSKLAKVIKQTLKLSELMSGIAQGVKAWALMQIPDDWDKKTGKPIHFRDLKPDEPKQAADNVAYIITTLGEAIMKAYDQKKDWYEDKSIFGKIGLDFGVTPFSKAINANIKLSSLITNIGEGLQKFAQLNVPIKWDKDGKPIDFKKMTDKEIQNAGDNVSYIVTVLGQAIMKAYDDHKGWYDDNSIFGKLGIDLGATPFSRAVSANVKLSELITNIAKGIQSMAQLNMPTKWNDEGQPIDFKPMIKDDFEAAGTNIGLVISTLGNAIMDVYNSDEAKENEWFESTSLFGKIFGSTDDTPFVRAVSINLRLSELITNIGKGMQEMAKLQMPDQWDKEGKPIHFVKLGPKDFENAGKHIGDVIKFLGETMMQTYKDHSDWYELKVNDDGEVIEGASPIQLAINGNHKMGELIKNMAEGIKAYSELDFAGVTKDMTDQQKAQIAKNTFQEAAANIKEVCTTVGKALMDIANDPTYGKWFAEIMETTVIKHTFGADDVQTKGTGRTPFGNIVGSMSKMGDLISGISEAISMYASMQIPGPDGKMIAMPKDTFSKAAEQIKSVIITIGAAIMGVYEANPKMFGGYDIETSLGARHIGGASEDNPFKIVVGSLSKMSSLISSLAEGLAAYASQQVAIEWDKDGKPIKFQPLTSADMTAAAQQIGSIVSTIGLAIGDAYNNSPEAFATDENGNSPAANVVKSLNILVPFVGKIGSNLASYAAEKVLIWDGGHDADGYKTYKEQSMTLADINKATFNIKQIVLAIAQAISYAYHSDEDLWESTESSPAAQIAKALNIMGPAIGKSAEYMGTFNMTYLAYGLDSTNIDTVKENLTELLSGIGAIYILFGSDDFDDYEDWYLDRNWEGGDMTFRETIDEYGMYLKMSYNKIVQALETSVELFMVVTMMTEKYFSLEQFRVYNAAIHTLPVIVNGLSMVAASVTQIMKIFGDLYEGKSDSLLNSLKVLTLGGSSNKVMGLQEFAKIAPNILKDLNTSINVFSGFTDRVLFSVLPRMSMLKALIGKEHVFEPLMEVIYSFRYAIQALGSNFEDLDTPSFVIKDLFKRITNVDDIDGDDFLSRITALSLSIRRLTEASIEATMAKDSGFQILQSGVANINKAISQVKNTKEFADQTKQLKKYVKAINDVKLENLKELFKFVNSVNKLAAKMGNLDKLTEALGTKLAGELKKLTEQLNEAKKTIEKAEKLQQDRHKKIEDSIKKIQDLMKEHMVVDIKVDSDLKSSK